MSSNTPEHLNPNAKFLVIAEITFSDSGKADGFEKHALAIQKVSNSDKEPGTLMFRISRGISPDEHHKFTALEEYANKAAYERHQNSEAFKALTSSDVMDAVEMQLAFRQECF
ncbi:hypothetical protein PQX77_021124 [Marasmius sp. AFHP31]|nr:hypothetical protein PQX77_021124 [Marasmius sp. AFHP31]